MEWEKITARLHVINLIIKNENYIPRLRNKVKVISKGLGLERLKVVQYSTAASEITRFLVQRYNNAKVEINFIQINNSQCGLQILFTTYEKKKVAEALDYEFDIDALKKFFDYLNIDKNIDDELKVDCIALLKYINWDELISKEEHIRNLCFGDMEEYYIENLKQKHLEVLRLLKETANKNVALDKMNNQLLQLTSDMEILAQERTITELTLKVADKIRNPITVIGGIALRLLNSKCLSDNDKTKIDVILKEIEKLETILKEFDELSQGKSKFFQRENLKDVVNEALNESIMMLNQYIEKKNIKIEFLYQFDNLFCIINKRTFKLAFSHVFRNAVYAVSQNGEIIIEIGANENSQYVEIKDNGPGIPEEVMNKLFKEAISTKPTGTGFGLILVKRILQEHQGDIEIFTEKGKGTIVKLLFPLRWKEAR